MVCYFYFNVHASLFYRVSWSVTTPSHCLRSVCVIINIWAVQLAVNQSIFPLVHNLEGLWIFKELNLVVLELLFGPILVVFVLLLVLV